MPDVEEDTYCHMQILWLDADTLWLDGMANMKQEFDRMHKKETALFGMALETSAMNAAKNYYKALPIDEGRAHAK